MGQPEQKDISAVIAEIERLIDEAISGVAIKAPVPTGNDLRKLFDLSSIDFDKLADLFKEVSKKTATEVLRGKAERKARDLQQEIRHEPDYWSDCKLYRSLQHWQHGYREVI